MTNQPHFYGTGRYAYFKKLDYFSTECIYSPDAYRGHARAFLKDLEAARPSAIIDIIHSGEVFEIKEEIKATQKVQRESRRCYDGLRVDRSVADFFVRINSKFVGSPSLLSKPYLWLHACLRDVSEVRIYV